MAEVAFAARSLATSLVAGYRLDPLALDGVPLLAGEHAYAEVDAVAWRWLPLDGAEYERRALLAGGPLLMCATGVLSVIGNSRRHRAAERAAAPQWRPLGPVRVVATERRLLVWHGQAWWSVWFDAIAGLHPAIEDQRLDITFHSDPPYRLAGPDVPVLAVVLAWLAAQAEELSEIA